MKKYSIILLVSICVSLQMKAEENAQIVRERIARIDSIYPDVSSWHQKDTLMSLVRSYRELDTILTGVIEQQNEIISIYEPYKDILFLFSNDIDIFDDENLLDLQVPRALEEHYQTVKMIITVRQKIEQIERKIEAIESMYAVSDFRDPTKYTEMNSKISSEIEGDMDAVTELMIQIKARNLSTLSPQQMEYFKPGLTGRYNNFIKFFE